MSITTKFTVASEEGIKVLMALTKALATEKFSAVLNATELDRYINETFNRQALLSELNSMSNQWLVVYVNDQPAGYAKITSKGKKPLHLDGKRTVRIADFGVLNEYADPAVANTLLEKCLSVCKFYDATWINEHTGSTRIDFFKSYGFIQQNESASLDEISLPSVCLVRQ